VVDLYAFGAFTDLKKHETRRIIDEINEAIEQWSEFCRIAGVPEDMAQKIAPNDQDKPCRSLGAGAIIPLNASPGNLSESKTKT
jgi:hypothetical protein